MAKVILIHPPNLPLNSPQMYFSLGLLYIASVLEKDSHTVQIIDLRSQPLEAFTSSKIPDADYYAVTATTGEYLDAIKIGDYIKMMKPNATTMVGGAHATVLPEDYVGHFDIIVRGEGEEVVSKIVNGGKQRMIIEGNPVKDLDSIPFPARHLVPNEGAFSYTIYVGEKYGTGTKSTAIISSRGCPFSCRFCAQPHVKVRFRSSENFVAEIKLLKETFDCHHYKFVDDIFTIDRRRLLEICEALEPLNIHYRCQTRSDQLTEEVCQALKRSGCEECAVGVESADDDVLQFINKSETVEEHKQAVKLIKEAGMTAKVYFMTGLPGEKWKTIRLNQDFMREVKPDKWTISMFMPYPDCDISKHPEKYGVKILSKDWSLYWNFTESVIETEWASNNELNDHYKVFYNYCRSEAWKST